MAQRIPAQSPDTESKKERLKPDELREIRDDSRSDLHQLNQDQQDEHEQQLPPQSPEHKNIMSTAVELARTHDRKEFIVELPRDILTAFFLLRLPRDQSRRGIPKGEKADPMWHDFSKWGRECLYVT